MKNIFYLAFIYFFFSCNQKPKTSQPPPETKEKNYTVKFEQAGGPFLIIGQGSCNVYAPNQASGYWWYKFTVTIQNNSDIAMVIKPADFWLYLSPTQNINSSVHYLPTDLGVQCQAGYLGNEVLEPGNQRTGTLTYELPEKIENSVPTNGGAYKLIRWILTPPADKYKVNYDPY
jgi:Domain of unknown function (DUF4352)